MTKSTLPATFKHALALLADGQVHSGTELAHALGISRAAICKQLHGLDALGLEYSAVSGKGYQLAKALELLNANQIQATLSAEAQTLLKRLDIYDQIDSTNRYLSELAKHQPGSGIVCLAEQQSAGRGRRGREWVSPFGHNIYLSLLWQYQQSPAVLAGLSLAVGVAVIRALHSIGVSGVGLKWPNDIYWQQRKLAGILIEVSGESAGPCNAVVGLGLNLYLPAAQAGAITQAWVDLNTVLQANLTGVRNRLIAALLNELLPMLAQFEQDGFSRYLDEWRQADCMQGKTVDIFIGEQRYSGEVVGIDDQGLLQLKQSDGSVRHFSSGEVSFRAP